MYVYPLKKKSEDLGATAMTMHFVENFEVAFSEFTFSSSMFTDHWPNNYEWALKSLLDSVDT